MHLGAMAFLTRAITAEDVAGQDVIEGGSLNVNGSIRGWILDLAPATYTGIDLRDGDSVDVVMDAADLPGDLGEAGLVVSSSMLEHAEDWQGALRGLVSAVKPGGVLVITVPSPGFPRHDHPGDWHRFPVDTLGAIIEAAGLDVLMLEPDGGEPGACVKARKPPGWAWPDVTTAWNTAGVTGVT